MARHIVRVRWEIERTEKKQKSRYYGSNVWVRRDGQKWIHCANGYECTAGPCGYQIYRLGLQTIRRMRIAHPKTIVRLVRITSYSSRKRSKAA